MKRKDITKIVYITPSIYIAGGVERVLTTKVNYLANQVDKYDVTIRSLVEKQCPNWRLDVYGAGDAKPYQKLAEELKLYNMRYALNGPTKDISQEYLHSSIFALSSRFEGFGMVILEAMSHGLAVVSFDCPCGPKAIIEDGVDGVLVENGEPEKLAQVIIQLIQDEDRRRALAAKAREKSRMYSIEFLGKQWEQLFVDVSDKDTPQPRQTDCAIR